MTEAQITSKRQTCTDHCGACGRHFHGLGAFDAHRLNFECLDPATTVYEEGKRAGEPRLQAWTEDGWCDLEPGSFEDGRRVRWNHPVVVWQVARTEAQEQWLAGARQQAQEPREGMGAVLESSGRDSS